MGMRFYDEYTFDAISDGYDFVIPDVQPIWTGNRIAGFLRVTNCAEVAQYHRQGIICYDPDRQRGYRIVYRDGKVEHREYLINPSKVKEIARSIAENREHNRFRTVNCRYGQTQLHFQPTLTSANGHPLLGSLFLRKLDHAHGELEGLLTIPDSAHRQQGDRHFTEKIAPSVFSPEHAGFTPETYDLILHISLTDEEGEGLAHYEHNELVSTSTATRRAYLEAGQRDPSNWVAHQLLKLNSVTRELVEVYGKSISKNSLKIITFNALTKGIEAGWKDWLSESSKEQVASEIDAILSLAREVVPEWSHLPFNKRKAERDNALYSQAIVQRAMLRLFADWRRLREEQGLLDWEAFRPVLAALKKPVSAPNGWSGEFLSRCNPLFYREEGAQVYQLNKTALLRKQDLERQGEVFSPNPLTDFTVQNTPLSQEYIYRQLKQYLESTEAYTRILASSLQLAMTP